jgi:predicted aspartyl protease
MKSGKRHRRPAAFWLVLAAGLLWAGVGSGEFYRYVDRDGHAVYVDDMGKVPEEYRDQLKTYREQYDHLPAAQRRIRLEEEQRFGEEMREIQSQQLEELRRKRQAAEVVETPIIVEGNKILVPVVLGYGKSETEAMLVLDTGASLIALHREVAERLDVREAEKTRMRVVGGGTVDADVVMLSYVTVGPYTKSKLRAGIIDHQGKRVSHGGLLGMNFLRGLDYSIDFSNQVIRWRGQQTQ